MQESEESASNDFQDTQKTRKEGAAWSFPIVSDQDVDQLVSLAEIHRAWGVPHSLVYQLVREQKLHRWRRRGQKAYYALSELIAVFGEPKGRGQGPISSYNPTRLELAYGSGSGPSAMLMGA